MAETSGGVNRLICKGDVCKERFLGVEEVKTGFGAVVYDGRWRAFLELVAQGSSDMLVEK